MAGLDHVPDACDGLTDVERRLLHHLGSVAGERVPSDRVVNAVRAELARAGVGLTSREIYDVLVDLARPFVARYPLVDGEGNFGSVDDDPAADAKYTRVRRSALGDVVAGGGAFPTLLANGFTGPRGAIPPHHLGELAAAIALRIERPSSTLGDIVALLPGPDYPSGGEVVDPEQLRDAYATGQGAIDVRAVIEFERQRGESLLVIRELPFGAMKGGDRGVICELAELVVGGYGAAPVRGRNSSGISDIEDYSDCRGMQLRISVREGHAPAAVRDELFERTRLQTAVPVLVVALVHGKPGQLSLLDLIDHYIEHQRSMRIGARDDIDAAIVRDLAALASLHGDARRTKLLGSR